MLDRSEQHRRKETHRRINTIGVAIVAACLLLSLRLWQLQVVRWGEFRVKADANRLRLQRLEGPRGIIYGRNGSEEAAPLADNRAGGDIMFVPAECSEDPALVCARLAELAGVDAEALLDRVEQARKARQSHLQIAVRRDAPHSVVARVEEYAHLLPGVLTIVRPHRRYLHGKTAGQILGYLGEIGPGELEELRPRYRMGDFIGRAGIERRYEQVLRGIDGRMLLTQYATGEPQMRTDAYGNLYVDVDSFGHRLFKERVQEPLAGQPLYLTLDIGLQATLESLLKGEHGAIVVLNAGNGAVLGMASSPSYDPTVFVKRGLDRQRLEVLQSKPNRLLSRAYQEVYAPGSIFKVLMASAALEEGVIDESTTFYCPGKFRLEPGGRAWHCWKRGGHGTVAVVDAIAFSCDVFFYNVGLELGVDRIHDWATRAGLGVKTGIDLPGEAQGLIPSRAWRVERLTKQFPGEPWNQRWFPGDTLNFSIGQGDAAITPLQAAVLMATLANGGKVIRPHLNRELEGPAGERIFSAKTVATVQAGMRKCVEKGPPAPTGTGKAAKTDGFTVIGKTGSAQVVGLEHHAQYEKEEDIPKDLRDHAWFIAGVLDREPAIAICILIEHGHHGSSVAAPLARDIIEFFYAHIGGAPGGARAEAD